MPAFIPASTGAAARIGRRVGVAAGCREFGASPAGSSNGTSASFTYNSGTYDVRFSNGNYDIAFSNGNYDVAFSNGTYGYVNDINNWWGLNAGEYKNEAGNVQPTKRECSRILAVADGNNGWYRKAPAKGITGDGNTVRRNVLDHQLASKNFYTGDK